MPRGALDIAALDIRGLQDIHQLRLIYRLDLPDASRTLRCDDHAPNLDLHAIEHGAPFDSRGSRIGATWRANGLVMRGGLAPEDARCALRLP